KGEEPCEQQEDHEEHVSDGRREIAAQLALHDRLDVGPGVHQCFTVSGSVIARNTSSRRPSGERAFNSCGVPLATMRPRSMMMTREHTASTSSRMCVEKMIALFAPICLMRLRTSYFWLGSSPSVGSSMIRTSGSWISDCARQVRCL